MLFLSLLLLLIIQHALSNIHSCTLYNDDGSLRPYRVVVSVDSRLLEVFVNWLIYYFEVCRNFNHLDIICLDTKVKDVITMLGLKCNPKSYYLHGQGKRFVQVGNKTVLSSTGTLWKSKDLITPFSEKLGSLWTRRIEIISEYISSDIDVILSDTDAIWLRDPLPDINSNRKSADMIASRAIYPIEQNLKWGSTVCMGFLYLNAGVFVDDFFLALKKTIIADEYPDDQKSLNELLDFNNITWPKQRMALDQNIYDLGLIPWSNTNNSHGILLLPHDSYLRQCHNETMARGSSKKARYQAKNNINTAIIAHCRVPKGQGFAKSHRLKAYALWKLRHGWKLSLISYFKKKKNNNINTMMKVITQD